MGLFAPEVDWKVEEVERQGLEEQEGSEASYPWRTERCGSAAMGSRV